MFDIQNIHLQSEFHLEVKMITYFEHLFIITRFILKLFILLYLGMLYISMCQEKCLIGEKLSLKMILVEYQNFSL